MFVKGQTVVYGSMGVCIVQDIRVPDMAGCDKPCYVLTPLHVQSSTIYAPVQNTPATMRPLLSPAEARALIDSFAHMDTFPPIADRQEQQQLYRTVLKSADCGQLARLVKTLYTKKAAAKAGRKGFSTGEKDVFNTAERVLLGELSTTLCMPLETLDGYIRKRVGGVAAVS